MQGYCVVGGIGVRSQQFMERVTVNTKSTRDGHSAQKCRCRGRKPMIDEGSQRSWPKCVEVPFCCPANKTEPKPSKPRNSRKHRNSRNSQNSTRARNSQKRRICRNSQNTEATTKIAQNQNYPQIPPKKRKSEKQSSSSSSSCLLSTARKQRQNKTKQF